MKGLAYRGGGTHSVLTFLAHAALWHVVGRFVGQLGTGALFAVAALATLVLLALARNGRRRR